MDNLAKIFQLKIILDKILYEKKDITFIFIKSFYSMHCTDQTLSLILVLKIIIYQCFL